MKVFRRIESATGQVLLQVLGFLLATLVVGILIGVANSNLFWGEANQYGRVAIPGHAVLHLPSGSVQVTAAAALPGRGNETPTLLVPDLGLEAVPVGGGPQADVRRDPGESVNANDSEVDTQRRIAYLDVPSAGDYRVKVSGDFTGYGVNAQLWFGYEPGFITGYWIWLVAAGVVLAGIAIAYLISLLRSRRRGRGGGADGDTGDGPVEAPPPAEVGATAD